MSAMVTEWLQTGASVANLYALFGIAVVAALIAWIFFLRQQKNKFGNLSQEQRDERLSRYKLDATNLTREQKTDLIRAEMDHKAKNSRLIFLLAAIVAGLFIAIAALTYIFRPADISNDSPRSREVVVEIFSDGKLVPRDFEFVYQDEKGHKSQASGKLGRSTIKIPQDVHILKTLEIDLRCFRQPKTGPFEIVEGRPILVSLERVTTPLPPPLLPTLIPDALAYIPIGDRPTLATLTMSPKVNDPGEFVLEHENRAGEFLVLLLFSLELNSEGQIAARLRHEVPSDHCLEQRIFNGFNEPIGWFGVLARTTDGRFEYLSCTDFYANKKTNLTIEKKDSKLVARLR